MRVAPKKVKMHRMEGFLCQKKERVRRRQSDAFVRVAPKKVKKTHRSERILGAQENHLRSLLIVNEEVVYRSATPKAPLICVF